MAVEKPCMRGVLKCENGVTMLEGRWALTAADFAIKAMTSSFKYRSTLLSDEYPASGAYEGHFMMMKKKHTEWSMNLNFSALGDGSWRVVGDGGNEFGPFSIEGTVDADGKVELFKELKTVEAPGTVTFHDRPEPQPASAASLPPPAQAARAPAPAAAPSKPKTDFTRQCAKVLRQLMGQPEAVWFNEPVDPVAHGLPTYFDVVRHPMDFGTIKGKLDAKEYRAAKAFIADVKLVFSNAKRFNDDPAHDVYKARVGPRRARARARWKRSACVRVAIGFRRQEGSVGERARVRVRSVTSRARAPVRARRAGVAQAAEFLEVMLSDKVAELGLLSGGGGSEAATAAPPPKQRAASGGASAEPCKPKAEAAPRSRSGGGGGGGGGGRCS